MTLHTWLAFVATSCIVLAIPGPTALIILRYATLGGRATLPRVVAGAVLGDSVALTICNFGLGALLAASSGLLSILKVAAAAYLIGLGLTSLFGRAATSEATGAAPPHGGRPFASVFLVTALNPKGLVFFCALLPQFVEASEPVLPQLVLLQATFCGLSLVAAMSWALAGTLLARTTGGLFRRVTGVALIGAGVAQMTGRLA
ncbi:LysE family translocator [Methylobacterium sp. AMS5]|uniref:LysE family translocator n=1 Tax=Methylobacterium sp. AMS5 TaxID=925818 RepID=UPI00074F91AA|nr:LysE family translocator [Methylobacterium sp. AMS5]AMB44201.1 lysine transporter LysE [Methylobacterium sp. AMS5]